MYLSSVLLIDTRETSLEVTIFTLVNRHSTKGIIIVLRHHMVQKTNFLVTPVIALGTIADSAFPFHFTMYGIHVINNIIGGFVAVFALDCSGIRPECKNQRKDQ